MQAAVQARGVLLVGLMFVAGGCASQAHRTGPQQPPLPRFDDSPFAVRGWQVHDYEMAYLRSVLERAPAYGINHVQLSHNICHFAEDILDDPQRQEHFRALARLAHRHGIKLYVWTHEIQNAPQRYRIDGRVNLDDEGLWDWLQDKYESLFRLVPELDGVILTFHETQTPVYKDTHVRSSLPPPRRITRLLNVVHSVLAERGKTLYARTFVRHPQELSWLIEGIRSADAGVRVMTKVVPRDWHQFGLRNPAIGAFPGRVQIVELDPAAEYYGQGKVPYCFPGRIQRWLQDALQSGAAGAVARIDRRANHAFGSGNELNLYAFSRLLADPAEPLADIERAYLAARYGPDACEILLRVFRRTAKIIPGFYLVKGFYFLNRHSRVPELAYATSHILSHSPVRWAPNLKRVEQLLLRPTEAFYEEIMDEKRHAVDLARACVLDVESLRPVLRDQDYETLTDWFGRELRCAELWMHLSAVFFRARMYQQARTDRNRSRLQRALDELARYADRLERQVGPDADWDSAAKARRFAVEVARSVGLATTRPAQGSPHGRACGGPG